MSVDTACHHRAAAYKDRRHIDSCRCHQKSRHVFVTVRNHNKGVELMGQSHCFCGICNKISCHKRIFHSHMSHCNSVADCDRREYNRSSACHGNSLLNGCHDFIQIHMSGYNFIIRADNSHQRSFHFLFCHSKSVEQGAMGRLLCSFFYCVTSHSDFSFIFLCQIAAAIKSPISFVPTKVQPSDMMSPVL